MGNKKIKNSTPTVSNNIRFRSKAEVMVYNTLLSLGFNPEYETVTYTLWEGFKPTIPFYTRNKKREHVLDLRKLINITYTPDFHLYYKGYKIIIEVKGFENDVYPYKFKMFRKYLEAQPDKDKYIIFEIFTKKQLLEAVEIIKKL